LPKYGRKHPRRTAAKGLFFPFEAINLNAVDVKVIMLGSSYIYYVMYQYDEDFRKLFKIHADFDVQMDNTPTNIDKMAAFASATIKKENLREFTRDAVARMVEHAVRLSGSQTKITARFNEIVEMLCEANTWASVDGALLVDGDHVRRAIEGKRYRANKYEEIIQEMFKEEKYLIDTDGSKIGQVNGLAVLGIGEYAFGKPSTSKVRTNPFSASLSSISCLISSPVNALLKLTEFMRAVFLANSINPFWS